MTRLEESTTEDAQDLEGSVLFVPLGSTEQHGPHLPLNTDSVIAEAWANGMAKAALTRVAVAPVLSYGASGEHQDFAGTLSIGTPALRLVLVEMVRSAAGRFARVVFVSGHAGNVEALSHARQQMVDEGHRVDVLVPIVPGGDAHAGHTETSLMLYLRADLVHMDRAETGNDRPSSDLMDAMREGGVIAVSANGVLGDPVDADAADGKSIMNRLIVDGVEQLGL